MKYLSVPEAAQVANLSPRTVYILIDQEKFPAEVEFVGKQKSHKVPIDRLALWMERKIEKAEAKLVPLKKNLKKLKEYM